MLPPLPPLLNTSCSCSMTAYAGGHSPTLAIQNAPAYALLRLTLSLRNPWGHLIMTIKDITRCVWKVKSYTQCFRHTSVAGEPRCLPLVHACAAPELKSIFDRTHLPEHHKKKAFPGSAFMTGPIHAAFMPCADALCTTTRHERLALLNVVEHEAL